MAFHYSPNIVSDKLVLYLDVANTRSYVSGSTIWNDLTPDLNNGTLINGPTFNSANGGSLVFNGKWSLVWSRLYHHCLLCLFVSFRFSWLRF